MKNEFAVGVDLEETKRFALKKGKVPIFFRKIFTAAETKYCLSKRFPERHFAARFAAKEAAIKALGGLEIKTLPYVNVEIANRKNGSPVIEFNNYQREIGFAAQLSMAHTGSMAIAFVIARKS